MDKDLDRLAGLLTDLIEKYADRIDLDNLPDPPPRPTTDEVVGIFLLLWAFSLRKRLIYDIIKIT